MSPAEMAHRRPNVGAGGHEPSISWVPWSFGEANVPEAGSMASENDYSARLLGVLAIRTCGIRAWTAQSSSLR
jgi:hypothetical protein